MKGMRNAMMAVALIAMAIPAMKVSAEPLHKEVYFTINVPFELRNSRVMLDEGKYILYQVSQSDLNLFWLYKENKMHTPIGVVRTTRIDYSSRRGPKETKMLLDKDEERNLSAPPVITGWAIPGMDGWEITGVKIDSDRASISRHEISHEMSKASRKKGHEISKASRKQHVIIKASTTDF